jgi:hypothetical protein
MSKVLYEKRGRAWTLARMDPPVIPRTNPPALSPESWAVR